MTTPDLSPADLRLILAALDAVTPTGGGSPQFHLARRLKDETTTDVDLDLCCRMQRDAAREIAGAFDGSTFYTVLSQDGGSDVGVIGVFSTADAAIAAAERELDRIHSFVISHPFTITSEIADDDAEMFAAGVIWSRSFVYTAREPDLLAGVIVQRLTLDQTPPQPPLPLSARRPS